MKKFYPDFEAFLETAKNLPESRNLNVESFMIKPVQRITKYPLLFKELLKTSEEGTEDYKRIYGLFTGFRDILAHVNEEKRKRDQHQHLVLMKDSFVSKSLEEAQRKVFTIFYSQFPV